jgi:hypothetical protein
MTDDLNAMRQRRDALLDAAGEGSCHDTEIDTLSEALFRLDTPFLNKGVKS